MKKILTAGILLFIYMAFTNNMSQKPSLYLDPDQSVDARVEDLMRQMTIEEKVAQMNQYVGLEHMRSAEKDLTVEELKRNTARGFYPGLTSKDIAAMTEKGLVGSFLHVVTPEEANQLQE